MSDKLTNNGQSVGMWVLIFCAVVFSLASIVISNENRVNLKKDFASEVRWLKAEVDSLSSIITPDTERQSFVVPSSKRIQTFLPSEKAYKVAHVIWEVSLAFAPRTDFSTYDFAMLMEAIAEHESGFKENALSPTGVPGPWQCSYTLAKALSNDPVIYRYAISRKRDLMDYEVSAWYGAAALSLFLEAYNQDLDIALLAWHDGEPVVNRGQATSKARYLRSNIKAILERNYGPPLEAGE